MQLGGSAGDVLSPESTVTSLLSSSGHLRSNLLAPERTTIRYRDKVGPPLLIPTGTEAEPLGLTDFHGLLID